MMRPQARRLMPGLVSTGRGRAPSLEDAELGIYELDGVTPCPPGKRPSTLALQGTPVENYRYIVRGPLAGGAELVIEGSARPIVQKRFDARPPETATWAAAGVEALMKIAAAGRPTGPAAGRLADELRKALGRLRDQVSA